MPQREEKHNKTKKKPPKSPTKKETLLEASCIAKKSFYDNPIISEKAQQKAPEASVQQGFHCSCFARNENLAISCSSFCSQYYQSNLRDCLHLLNIFFQELKLVLFFFYY